jgi:hypothetical protein
LVESNRPAHPYLPSPGDATPQTSKVAMTLPNGGVKRIDSLRSIIGLDTAKIQARAAALGALPETLPSP